MHDAIPRFQKLLLLEMVVMLRSLSRRKQEFGSRDRILTCDPLVNSKLSEVRPESDQNTTQPRYPVALHCFGSIWSVCKEVEQLAVDPFGVCHREVVIGTGQ